MIGPLAPRARTPEIVARMIFGLMLMLLGLALLASNFGWLSAQAVFVRAWPFALMVLGIMLLAQQRSPLTLVGSTLVLAGIGALASQQQWIHVSLRGSSGPAVIVLVGLSLIWRAIRKPTQRELA